MAPSVRPQHRSENVIQIPRERKRVYIVVVIVTVLLTAFGCHQPKNNRFLQQQETDRQPLSGKIARELDLSGRYAVATYCLPHRVKRWKCGSRCPGKLHVQTYFSSAAGVAGYVGLDKNARRIVVAFRGSIDYRNWVWDLQFAKIDYPYPPNEAKIPTTAAPMVDQTQHPLNETQPMIHSGFWISYMSVRRIVLETVRDLLLTEMIPAENKNTTAPRLSILVTGHSLGAALATFAALDIQAFQSPDGFADQNFFLLLHQFGGPRVGNQAFANIVQKTFVHLDDDKGNDIDPREEIRANRNSPRALRVVNQNEWVPHLPPTRFGFAHHPHEIWIADGSEISNDLAFKPPNIDWSRPHDPPGPAYSCNHDLQSPNFTEDPMCSSKVPWWQWSLEAHARIWSYDVTVIC